MATETDWPLPGRALIEKAEAVRRHSRQIASAAARTRREWSIWHEAWNQAARLREDTKSKQLLVVLCAYCRRVRDAGGEWSSIPRLLELRLADRSSKYVSHGLCPECMRQHFSRLTQLP
jgi:hypothetical protein